MEAVFNKGIWASRDRDWKSDLDDGREKVRTDRPTGGEPMRMAVGVRTDTH